MKKVYKCPGGPKRNNKVAQNGATLIEVLTSLLILSFGSLGAAGLQITSKQAAYDAQQMLTASFLSNAIVEKMRNKNFQRTFLVLLMILKFDFD